MNMKEFLIKFNTDSALAERMSKCTDAHAAYAVAKEAGLTDDFETSTATMKKLNDTAGEMSANELDAIAGGSNVSVVVLTASAISVHTAGMTAAATT